MEEYTIVQVKVPKDLDYKLNLWLAELKKLNIKSSKANEIIRLATIGYNTENNEKTI